MVRALFPFQAHEPDLRKRIQIGRGTIARLAGDAPKEGQLRRGRSDWRGRGHGRDLVQNHGIQEGARLVLRGGGAGRDGRAGGIQSAVGLVFGLGRRPIRLKDARFMVLLPIPGSPSLRLCSGIASSSPAPGGGKRTLGSDPAESWLSTRSRDSAKYRKRGVLLRCFPAPLLRVAPERC